MNGSLQTGRPLDRYIHYLYITGVTDVLPMSMWL